MCLQLALNGSKCNGNCAVAVEAVEGGKLVQPIGADGRRLLPAAVIRPVTRSACTRTMLVCGNDFGAKTAVTSLLKSMGWRDIIDLGDISKARGTEMLLPLWLNLFGLFSTPHFGFKVVRA